MIKFIQNPYGASERPGRGGYGRLKVHFEDRNINDFLPMYTMVQVKKVASNREYFTVLEGPHVGRPASVSMALVKGGCWFSGVFCSGDTYVSRLADKSMHTGPATVRYQKVPPVSEAIGATERTQVSISGIPSFYEQYQRRSRQFWRKERKVLRDYRRPCFSTYLASIR